MKTVGIAFAETFGVLFPIVDPIGNTPTFMALTSGWDEHRSRRLIWEVVLMMFAVLSVFAVIGEPILHFFGISLEGLEIAGGIVIGYTGFQMITAAERFVIDSEHRENVAIYPLTVPLLAGPGAMAAILALDAREGDVALALPGVIAAIAAVGVFVFIAFTAGEHITRFLGLGGRIALTTIMGLIVLSIGVELVVHGIVEHGAVVHAIAGHGAVVTGL
jgi:multiple antibiotic resistance protein